MNDNNSISSGTNSNSRVYVLISAVIVLAIVVTFLAYTVLTGQTTATSGDIDAQIDYLKLVSFNVQADGGSIIGPIEEGMKLKKGEPITLRANFSSPNANAADFIVVSQVRNNESQDVARSTIQARLEGSNILLDTFWNPSEAGEYTITIYVLKASDFNRTGIIPPVFSVSVIIED